MSEAQAAFARYYKSERERSEKTLADILDLLTKPGTTDDAVNAILVRLEAHWGRYDEPGSLAPLGAEIADMHPFG